MTLAGRTAIITGASLGLGAAIAEHFAASGASLLLCARNADALESQRAHLAKLYPSIRLFTHCADVARREDVDALFDLVAGTLGRLDILVNNAGVYGPMGTIETVDWNDWCDAIAVNLIGAVYCSRKAVTLFKPNRYGKIINLSGGGATSPLPGISAYAASKAGLVRFTETLALEVKEFGIDVNALAPGALATRLTEQLIAAGPQSVGASLHERMKKIQTEGGTPLSVGAQLCGYLASADSDGVTGRLIAAPWDPWPFTAEIKEKIAASDIYTLRRVVPADRGQDWGDR